MATPNPRLIRLVTSRFRELQGLSTISDAGMLGMLAGTRFVDSYLDVIVLAMLLTAYLWARFARLRPRIDAYYADRFGRVGSLITLPTFMFAFNGIMFTLVLRDMHVPAAIAVAFAMASLAGPAIWYVVRDFPYRIYWLLPAAVGLVWPLSFGPVTTMPEAYAWQQSTALAYGMALALAGLCDHLLLVTALKPQVPGTFRLKAEATEKQE